MNGRPLAAHNAEFDIGFIRAGCKKVGLPFSPTYVDSLILAQNLLPDLGKYKLDIVADHLELPNFNHHRASDDAATVGYMLIPFWRMLHERGVHTLQAVNQRDGEAAAPGQQDQPVPQAHHPHRPEQGGAEKPLPDDLRLQPEVLQAGAHHPQRRC